MFIAKECYVSGTREGLTYAATGANDYERAPAPHTLPGTSLAIHCAAGRDSRPNLSASVRIEK